MSAANERPSAERVAELRAAVWSDDAAPAWALHVVRDLFRELDAVTKERDEWERKANQAADNFDALTKRSRSDGLDWVSEHGGT